VGYDPLGSPPVIYDTLFLACGLFPQILNKPETLSHTNSTSLPYKPISTSSYWAPLPMPDPPTPFAISNRSPYDKHVHKKQTAGWERFL